VLETSVIKLRGAKGTAAGIVTMECSLRAKVVQLLLLFQIQDLRLSKWRYWIRKSCEILLRVNCSYQPFDKVQCLPDYQFIRRYTLGDSTRPDISRVPSSWQKNTWTTLVALLKRVTRRVTPQDSCPISAAERKERWSCHCPWHKVTAGWSYTHL
jgi:hypothetical protein